MKDHQKRVIDEQGALVRKLEALERFIGGEGFKALDGSEQARLRQQATAMGWYSDVLAGRITALDLILRKLLEEKEKEPEHVWEHGDVFKSGNGFNTVMIYIEYNNSNIKSQAICVGNRFAYGPALDLSCLKNAEFLFNIKEKL